MAGNRKGRHKHFQRVILALSLAQNDGRAQVLQCEVMHCSKTTAGPGKHFCLWVPLQRHTMKLAQLSAPEKA